MRIEFPDHRRSLGIENIMNLLFWNEFPRQPVQHPYGCSTGELCGPLASAGAAGVMGLASSFGTFGQ
jgi:hypothetical protein